MDKIKDGFETLWTDVGYKSDDVKKPDDRGNALAVLSGLADESRYDVIANLLTKTMNSSPYMEYYVLEALCQMDKYAEAKQRMLQRYGSMIESNDTTLWEKWSRYTGTRNHAWSGGPLVIMSKYFAGIRPTKAGYSEFVIKPQLSSPDKINCVVPSVRGYISVTEEKTDGAFILDASVPKDTTATVYVPINGSQTVKFNGKVIYQSNQFVQTQSVSFIKAENGYAVFSVKAENNSSFRFETNN